MHGVSQRLTCDDLDVLYFGSIGCRIAALGFPHYHSLLKHAPTILAIPQKVQLGPKLLYREDLSEIRCGCIKFSISRNRRSFQISFPSETEYNLASIGLFWIFGLYPFLGLDVYPERENLSY